MPGAPDKLPALPSGHRLAYYRSIDSTNAEALRRAASGEGGPLWIWADRQTAGRGRRGRAWFSPPGNLYASLLLSTTTASRNLTEISILAGLAAFDAVAGFSALRDCQLALKWPNDLLVNGAKIAGLLIECEGSVRPQALAIGFGVNVNQHPDGVPQPVTDLSRHGVEVVPGEVLERLAGAFASWLETWERGSIDALHNAWVSRLSGLGETVTVRLADDTLTGRLLGVDGNGGLTLQQADGSVRVIMAGDVFLPSGGRDGAEREPNDASPF